MRNVWLLFLVGVSTGLISEKLLVSSESPFYPSDDLYLDDQTSGYLPIDDEDNIDDYSGSGSGDYDELLRRILNFSKTTVSKEMVPFQPQSTADTPQNPSTTVAAPTTNIFPDGDNREEEVTTTGPKADQFPEGTSPSSTKLPPSETTTKFSLDVTVTKDIYEDNILDNRGVSTSKDEENVPDEVENVIPDGQRDLYEMEPEEVTSESLWERTDVLAAVIACGVIGFLCAVFLLLLLAYRMKKKDEGSYDLGDTKLSTTAYHKAPTKEFYA